MRRSKWIKSIVSEPEVGEIYDGKVVKVVDFGAFVNFFGARDGLVHVSELAPRRVAKVTDVVKEGDMVKVKLLGFDNRGKVRLSMKRSTSRPARTCPRSRARKKRWPRPPPSNHRNEMRWESAGRGLIPAP